MASMFYTMPFYDRDVSRAARLMDYGGGGLLEDLYSTPAFRRLMSAPRQKTNTCAGSPSSRNDSNSFQVMLNVKHFRPEEIDVKVVDNFVVIHGKHEETADDHGFVSREFTRRYQLPEGVESELVTSSLSQGGVLTIRAPMKALEPPPSNERVVPIVYQQSDDELFRRQPVLNQTTEQKQD